MIILNMLHRKFKWDIFDCDSFDTFLSPQKLSGFIIYQEFAVSLERVKLGEENTIQLSWRRPAPIGGL